ncbi:MULTISPECIES: circularly permuted type 2 ATP-grasp protein [unclassified Caballeronia]|uniref:circularly permuted type 2 ATP-grasp protein n=1 Tax=unclassified Caballeronia TaxID=2646786 RepID=UPI00285D467A|nr:MULTISPECIES: circularly permuted type 2 ATP-grasp protein [unclassified Caballeronia]MDR5740687.1 circularly permuted type 2 ATP-grasp protein [Caballeronia sp. LZ016]MDR5808790.1 circularly permuted type 2 ATP-grasp protein [Caballeronia sp. LZ019]
MTFQSTLPFDASAARIDPLAMLRALPAREGRWDELRDASGQLREPWRHFFALLGEQGIARLDDGVAAVAQQVRDNDITYNVYADNGEPRAWSLDLLPLVIDEDEWAIIERGVAQRARLMEAIVADVYGPQTLLHRGLLPGALVYGHPGYLRSVKGFVPPNERFLQIVAVDLARSPSGAWTVIAHRTEAPSGLGYALENRLIVASLFTEPFRAMRVSRLASTYSQLVATLAQAARATMHGDEGARNDAPHIALLSPGPFSETYFEHVFLARYLGVTLVEGKDLTVRQDKLYLKTLAGLSRVHAVLRRLDDAFCDPVELRADSSIGVPGLLQVMRAGNVAISNVPGAGFTESPALNAFLPGIADALLDEALQLPTVPTWWCGEEAARREAFERVDDALLVPTWPGMQAHHAPGIEAGVQKLADWQERIERAPDAFTVQQSLPFSCAPRFHDGALGARPCVLRAYAIADMDGAWRVMPGGFTRLAGDKRATVSMQLGGSSVDTWVLSSHAAPPAPLRPTIKPGDLRKHRIVSSRAAENLFWAGRYGERAENNVRLCRLLLGSLDTSDADAMFSTLVELARQCGLIPSIDTLARSSPHAFERVLVAGLAESAIATSIGGNLADQTRACGEIRDRLSTDHWRTILASRNDFRDALARLGLASPEAGFDYDRVMLAGALEHLATQLLAISGAQGDRMTRDEAWRLIFIGRMIERVSTMATFLRVAAERNTLGSPAGFELLLQLFDSTLTYRSLYPGRMEVPALIDLIVVDETNPRGLYGVYARLCAKLDDIAASAGGRRHADLSGILSKADALPQLDALCETADDGRYDKLVRLCNAMIASVSTASGEVSARFFSHANTLAAQVSS